MGRGLTGYNLYINIIVIIQCHVLQRVISHAATISEYISRNHIYFHVYNRVAVSGPETNPLWVYLKKTSNLNHK